MKPLNTAIYNPRAAEVQSGYFGYGVKDQREIYKYKSSYEIATLFTVKSKKLNNQILRQIN